MVGMRRGRWAAVAAVAALAVSGLAGCEKTPPVLTVEPVRFAVGLQVGPSHLFSYDEVDFYNTPTRVPYELRWSATDNNTVCTPTYSMIENGSHWARPMFTESNVTGQTVYGDDDQDNFGGPNLEGWTIRAHDCSGNTDEEFVGGYSYVTQDNGHSQDGYLPGAITAEPAEAWTEIVGVDYSGGTALRSTTVGATVTYTKTYKKAGTPVALVVNRGNSFEATFDVLIDGRRVATIHDGGPPRTISWAGTIADPGTHTLTVRVVEGAVDVDAFIFRGDPYDT